MIKRGAEVQFSNDLHAKVYWSEGGCIITSANLSNRALGKTNQKETGILIDSGSFDIDRLVNEVKPYDITQNHTDSLERQDREIRRAIGTRQRKKTAKNFREWHTSPYREPWKIGWWSESDLKTAKSAKEKSKQDYNVAEPVGVLNVSKSQVATNDWLLCFGITNNSIRKIEWMYVDFVVPVDAKDAGAYENDYPFQAVQVHRLGRYPAPPFVIDKDFRVAFKKAAKEYGTNKIENSKRLVATKTLIGKVVSYIE